MTELKQVNFKLSVVLHEQLKKIATTKGVTVTDLLVHGVHQVLRQEASQRAPSREIDFELYKHIEVLEQRFSDRITALEKEVEDLKNQILEF